MFGSANRDEAHFEAADQFRPGRDTSKAIAFGAGLYAALTFGWAHLHALHPETVWRPWHFLHVMGITVPSCVAFALRLNRVVFGRRAVFGFDAGDASAA